MRGNLHLQNFPPSILVGCETTQRHASRFTGNITMIEFYSLSVLKGICMLRIRTIFCLLTAALLFSVACSTSKAPGVWVTQDTGTGDSFFSANFVNENIGWLNGVGGRSYETPEENDNANKKPNPKKPGAKVEDPLKANQGFEVLQTTDSGQTWRQIPDQFKNRIRSVWFVDPQQGWALTI